MGASRSLAAIKEVGCGYSTSVGARKHIENPVVETFSGTNGTAMTLIDNKSTRIPLNNASYLDLWFINKNVNLVGSETITVKFYQRIDGADYEVPAATTSVTVPAVTAGQAVRVNIADTSEYAPECTHIGLACASIAVAGQLQVRLGKLGVG